MSIHELIQWGVSIFRLAIGQGVISKKNRPNPWRNEEDRATGLLSGRGRRSSDEMLEEEEEKADPGDPTVQMEPRAHLVLLFKLFLFILYN